MIKKEIKQDYKSIFKTQFNKKDDDAIFLNIKINAPLQKALKSAVVQHPNKEEKPYTTYHNGDEFRKIVRHTIKRVFLNYDNSGGYSAIFNETLLKERKLSIPFYTIDRLKTFLTEFKTALKSYLNLLEKDSKINENITYEIVKSENEKWVILTQIET